MAPPREILLVKVRDNKRFFKAKVLSNFHFGAGTFGEINRNQKFLLGKSFDSMNFEIDLKVLP